MKDQPRQERHRPGQSRVGSAPLASRTGPARASPVARWSGSAVLLAPCRSWTGAAVDEKPGHRLVLAVDRDEERGGLAYRALNERPALVSPAIPSGAASLTSAPAAISSRAISILPCRAANRSGVNRSFDRPRAGRRPREQRPHHVDVILDDGAHQGGLAEAALGRGVRSAPRQELRTTVALPVCAAIISGVSPTSGCDVRIGAGLQQALDHRGAAVQDTQARAG